MSGKRGYRRAESAQPTGPKKKITQPVERTPAPGTRAVTVLTPSSVSGAERRVSVTLPKEPWLSEEGAA